jgi:phosphatidyl-myo-inositol alpha-mannosyltransferase
MPLLRRPSHSRAFHAPRPTPPLPPLAPGPQDRPRRIALVTEYYYPHLGGICEHVHFFAREARRRGHHVDIVTPWIAGTKPMPHVIPVGRSQPVYGNGSLARIAVGFNLRRDMRGVLRAGQYDIVHAHSPLTPVLPVLAVDEAECPVVGTFHTYFDRSLGYALSRRYFQRRLDRLSAAIAVSKSTTIALRRYFDADWRIIRGSFPTASTPTSSARTRRSRLGSRATSRRFFSLGASIRATA